MALCGLNSSLLLHSTDSGLLASPAERQFEKPGGIHRVEDGIEASVA